MRICEIYAHPDGSIAHVWDMNYGTPDADTSLVAVFDIEIHPTEYQFISANPITWDGSNLLHLGTIYLSAAWIAQAEAEVAAMSQIQAAESELASSFSAMRPYLPVLKSLQLKLLSYLQTYGSDPDAFGIAQLDSLYTDLKAAFAGQTYWRNRLSLLIKRRAIAQGLSLANVNALMSRIANGTETSQDKALIWDAAETLISQATISALIAR